MKGRLVFGLAVFALAIAAALGAPNTYYLFVLGMVVVTTIVSVGLNILAGLLGQISIGHAGFFAIGAYTGSLLLLKAQWHFGLALVMAAIAANRNRPDALGVVYSVWAWDTPCAGRVDA